MKSIKNNASKPEKSEFIEALESLSKERRIKMRAVSSRRAS